MRPWARGLQIETSSLVVFCRPKVGDDGRPTTLFKDDLGPLGLGSTTTRHDSCGPKTLCRPLWLSHAAEVNSKVLFALFSLSGVVMK